jgi:hypothetical protein
MSPLLDGRSFFRVLSGLDFGLRVRVRRQQSQGTIFCGAENLSVQALTSELTEMVSDLSCTATRCVASSNKSRARCR